METHSVRRGVRLVLLACWMVVAGCGGKGSSRAQTPDEPSAVSALAKMGQLATDPIAQHREPHRGPLLPLIGRNRDAGLRHSITSSARASTDGGSVTSRVLAAFKLTTSSNTVGRSIGSQDTCRFAQRTRSQ